MSKTEELEGSIKGMMKAIDKLAVEMTMRFQRLEENRGESSQRNRSTMMEQEASSLKQKEKEGEPKPPDDDGGGGVRYKKLEMPLFTGENPDARLFRAELYFEIQQVKEVEKINVVLISFQKDVID